MGMRWTWILSESYVIMIWLCRVVVSVSWYCIVYKCLIVCGELCLIVMIDYIILFDMWIIDWYALWLAYVVGWIAFVHNTCYVFTYYYAIMIWLEFSPFCWNDAFTASCRLVAWKLFEEVALHFVGLSLWYVARVVERPLIVICIWLILDMFIWLCVW